MTTQINTATQILDHLSQSNGVRPCIACLETNWNNFRCLRFLMKNFECSLSYFRIATNVRIDPDFNMIPHAYLVICNI